MTERVSVTVSFTVEVEFDNEKTSTDEAMDYAVECVSIQDIDCYEGAEILSAEIFDIESEISGEPEEIIVTTTVVTEYY